MGGSPAAGGIFSRGVEDGGEGEIGFEGTGRVLITRGAQRNAREPGRRRAATVASGTGDSADEGDGVAVG
jgi:hypothetical protein